MFGFFFLAADVKDVIGVNCENSRWGAGVNLTSLRVLQPHLSKANQIYLTSPNCYGFIYDDLLLFEQLYDECSSNKSVNILLHL